MTKSEMLDKARKYAERGQTTLTEFWELRADGHSAHDAFAIMRDRRS